MNGFMTKCDKKRANLFILAMIGSSYFADAPSKIRGIETVAADYAEMKKSEQERRERVVIRAFEEFGEAYLDIFGDMRCAVYACTTENSTCIWFRTGFEEAVLRMDESGYVSDARIVHSWRRKDWGKYLQVIFTEERKEKEAEEKRERVREQKMRFLSKNGLLKCETHKETLENGDIRIVFSGKGCHATYVLHENYK